MPNVFTIPNSADEIQTLRTESNVYVKLDVAFREQVKLFSTANDIVLTDADIGFSFILLDWALTCCVVGRHQRGVFSDVSGYVTDSGVKVAVLPEHKLNEDDIQRLREYASNLSVTLSEPPPVSKLLNTAVLDATYNASKKFYTECAIVAAQLVDELNTMSEFKDLVHINDEGEIVPTGYPCDSECSPLVTISRQWMVGNKVLVCAQELDIELFNNTVDLREWLVGLNENVHYAKWIHTAIATRLKKVEKQRLIDSGLEPDDFF